MMKEHRRRYLMIVLAAACLMALAPAALFAQDAPMPPKPLGGPESSIGFSILGPQLIGMELRQRIGRPADFELGVGLRQTLTRARYSLDYVDRATGESKTYESDAKYLFDQGVLIAPGFVFWVSQSESEPKGPNRHGIFLKFGYNIGTVQEWMGALGYSYERFKNKEHVYSFDVGLMMLGLIPDSQIALAQRAFGKTVTIDGQNLHLDPIKDVVVQNYTNYLYLKWSWRWPF